MSGGETEQTDAAGGERRVAVIFNPVKQGVDQLRPLVEDLAAEHGSTVDWIETTEDDPGTGQARDARTGGADLIIAAGGDGTVRAIA